MENYEKLCKAEQELWTERKTRSLAAWKKTRLQIGDDSIHSTAIGDIALASALL
jgi:hypothetical protein